MWLGKKRFKKYWVSRKLQSFYHLSFFPWQKCRIRLLSLVGQLILSYFFVFFLKKSGKNDFLLQKGGPKRGPIQMDSYSQISVCEGVFSVPWFDFWKIVEADLTLSETLVPFAEITFFPNTIFDFYRGGSDPFRDACTLRKNHFFPHPGRTDEHLDSKAPGWE